MEMQLTVECGTFVCMLRVFCKYIHYTLVHCSDCCLHTVIVVHCSVDRSRDSSGRFVDVLLQAVAGWNPFESSGVRRHVPNSDVLIDWYWWLRHPGHIHCWLLCHCQPQPTMPYAGL